MGNRLDRYSYGTFVSDSRLRDKTIIITSLKDESELYYFQMKAWDFPLSGTETKRSSKKG